MKKIKAGNKICLGGFAEFNIFFLIYAKLYGPELPLGNISLHLPLRKLWHGRKFGSG